MDEQLPRSRVEPPRRRCGYCGYPITDEPVSDEETTTEFCSTICRDRSADDDAPDGFAGDRAYTRFRTGVAPLDELLPNGMPADAFVLLSGEEGTRRSELATELVWRALRRGEPAVVVAVADPPAAVLERFFALGWNVLPDLADDRLRIVDCFTHRLEDRDAFDATLNEWNEFVTGAADDAVMPVRDPTDVREVVGTFERALDDLEMTETGVGVIDSLDALDALGPDGIVHSVVEEVRANVCKARYVPVFASVTTAEHDGYPAKGGYVFDAIVDTRQAEHLVPETRLNQLAIRKCTGARYSPEWIAYESYGERGLLPDEVATEAGPIDSSPIR